ncbi:ShlB/FhaC/HecB family hemolysin secretion/activation protein [Pelagihabitans pacificus]|uniref:ShlB/FhaC/HecB family hemolysin secretion/activation protein n=1 Tax=Pelagihabitans pacificus TaxID=2696054 RepID=UPI001EE7E89D|nr:ShlB/FhaC/HecB family hemolysin secretion/activation protein [Pelagihabitans pacificus]
MEKSYSHLIASLICGIIFLIVPTSCATYRPQLAPIEVAGDPKEIDHVLFLAGGFGNGYENDRETVLAILKRELQTAEANSTLLLLGDNISDEKDAWSRDRKLIGQQLNLIGNFKGFTIFLPGNNEWKGKKISDLEKTEEYLDEYPVQDEYVFPKNGCPLDYRIINENLDLLLIDSKWFNSNWSRVEGINSKCTDVVTRRRFAEELEGYINDAQEKNLVIAMHHPIFSNGEFAGPKSLKSHLLPLPIVGSLLSGVDNLAAFSPDKLLSRRYNHLRILVSSLAKKSDRITIVSGHEQNLQYLSGGNIHQLISGALGEVRPTRRSKDYITAVGGTLPYEGRFTYGAPGFAKLVYYTDGSSAVTFLTADKEYTFDLVPPFPQNSVPENFQTELPKTQKRSVYGPEGVKERTAFFEYLWGKRYRRYYGIPVTAPVSLLDTLYGGLEVTKKGGGHQSYSIRLEDSDQREFSMRSLRKDPLKYLKFSVRGVAYTEDDYMGSLPERLISDFFTSAHPYMQMVINPMARAVGVNHADTRLFYVPKQKALGRLNGEFGNELYYIEQRPSDEQVNYKGYRRTIDEKGKVTDFESTTDMLEKIKRDESYTVDQQSYVRARVFDMLLGDWDRHQDQWRWVEYEKPDGEREFMPVPRDRDNAFPRFDGNAVEVIQWFIPITRQWQSYGPTIEDVKWINYNGNRLDQTLLPDYDAAAWEREALYIQQNLPETIIDEAFLRLPKEVQDSTSNYIKASLKQRLKDLPKYAREYGAHLNRTVALHGTEKDDVIKVVRERNGSTTVIIRRLLTDEVNEKFYQRTFDPGETKEIWIYGLGDDDRFEVVGDHKAKIFIRLIGGYGKDIFTITNKQKLKVYDWTYEETDFKALNPAKQLTDVYKTNTFHWRHFKPSRNILVPTVGFRTDDGLFLGAKNTFIYNGFNGNPFRQKHMLHAKYHFKFQATELTYKGQFANIFPKWNFEVDAYATSDRYAKNFFGLGNDSFNNEETFGRDYYRARLEQFKLSAGITYYTLRIRPLFESYQLSAVGDRLFTRENFGDEIFNRQYYTGGETSLYYYNDDADDFPTKGLYFGLTLGYKANLSLNDNQFGYFAFRTEVSRKLIPSGDLVFGTTAEYKTNFGGDYFFYHAPSLGGDNGLRGFRDERFTGRSYFYQSSDLRWRIKRYVTALAPVTMGAYGGFDYGRVWQPNENSDRWHTSQGIGLWVGVGNYLGFNAGVFNSSEDIMVQVGFGFGF